LAISLKLDYGAMRDLARGRHPATPRPNWAGHSLSVLLTVYAQAVDGQEEAARRRIEQGPR
jgi:hypothetical protein